MRAVNAAVIVGGARRPQPTSKNNSKRSRNNRSRSRRASKSSSNGNRTPKKTSPSLRAVTHRAISNRVGRGGRRAARWSFRPHRPRAGHDGTRKRHRATSHLDGAAGRQPPARNRETNLDRPARSGHPPVSPDRAVNCV
jgi:hypothetical protein